LNKKDKKNIEHVESLKIEHTVLKVVTNPTTKKKLLNQLQRDQEQVYLDHNNFSLICLSYFIMNNKDIKTILQAL